MASRPFDVLLPWPGNGFTLMVERSGITKRTTKATNTGVSARFPKLPFKADRHAPSFLRSSPELRVYLIVNETLAFDLSTSWDLDSVEPKRFSRGRDYPETRRPSLWYDSINDYVYSYGGWAFDLGAPPAAWGFKPGDDGAAKWEIMYTAGDSTSFDEFTLPGYALSAQSNTSFYALGGVLTSTIEGYEGLGNQPAIRGMATYDFQTEMWRNISTASSDKGTYGQEGFAALGEGKYVSTFGEEGVLIFIGGDSPTSNAWSNLASLMPMSTITIFDIHTEKWYTQKATGDVPRPRGTFCSVAVASNNGTSEIIIFGGTRNEDLDEDTYEDLGRVYILTLPAFEWVAVPSSTATPSQRASHNCQLIGNRQMLLIGGAPVTRKTNDLPKDENLPNGLGMFDVSDLSWKDSYDADAAPYEQSKLVQDVYAFGSGYPKSWDTREVQALFDPTDSSTKVSQGDTDKESLESIAIRTGATAGTIAGSVIGGVLGLAIIAAIVFICLRRRKRYANIGQGESQNPFNTPPPEHAFNNNNNNNKNDSGALLASSSPQPSVMYELDSRAKGPMELDSTTATDKQEPVRHELA
ncbi:hypothetical protein AJ80_00279 [Polytolypa hystricis UAMH7299]|uniref:Kelch repeat protein n=1 Tax=Polytolypa hystricis (strain UAMH7299) TaxID=1447883 RepID=A0A2B7YVB7_POLH7|nr:hypothetical protein AJ80_00279 [Polytolypa hystricis UAMH7299]